MLMAVQGHPNVVRFHGLFHLSKLSHNSRELALMMECCNGGDLFDAIAKRPFSEKRAREIMRGILDALAHVHACGIVHRDVKVENTLLDHAGRPVLTDFGLSVRLSDSEEMAKNCGSPGYAASEVLC